uniref:Uncharacterized protein n=1 Tax=Arundo donax TaxID=35708 RepID=A0A0A9AHT4_ARUDO
MVPTGLGTVQVHLLIIYLLSVVVMRFEN